MSNALLATKKRVYPVIDSLLGILIASIVIFLWLSSLVVLLCINVSQIPLFWIVSAVLVRTFLHTGLFITAHEAMHGTVFPLNRQVNNFVGSVATWMYVFLPYQTLLTKHKLHHGYPATTKDPDFYEPGQNNPFIWYGMFMKRYLDGKQIWVTIIGVAIVFYLLRWGLNIPMSNILLFWGVPIIISSVQLFYFGIFLPHRRPEDGYTNRHCAKSNYYSVFWSFITCYHFGYHWEHHEYPHLPWYRLPSVVKLK